MTPTFNPGTPRFAFWFHTVSALSLIVVNLALLIALIAGASNTFAAAIVVTNMVAFTIRATYALVHRKTLFDEDNYRSTEQAAGAERVGLYVIAVVMVSALIELPNGAFSWGMDTSLGELGQAAMLLAVTAPMVTYFTSGHGKMRRIVREQTQEAEPHRDGA